jgi:hypothetical protein
LNEEGINVQSSETLSGNQLFWLPARNLFALWHRQRRTFYRSLKEIWTAGKEAELNAVNNGIAVVPENGDDGHRSVAVAVAEYLEEAKLSKKPVSEKVNENACAKCKRIWGSGNKVRNLSQTTSGILVSASLKSCLRPRGARLQHGNTAPRAAFGSFL